MTSSRTISSRFLQKLTILNISTFSYQLRKNSIEEDEFGLYKVQMINKNGIFTTFYDVIKQGTVFLKHHFPCLNRSSVELNNFKINMQSDFNLTSDVVCSLLIFFKFKYLIIKDINFAFKNCNYLF